MAHRTQGFNSRQSMENGSFEIFHYKDKKLSDIGMHHHDFYEVYFFLGGQVNFRVEGKSYRLEPGDLLLISPQELHQAQIGPDSMYERIVLWIDRAYLNALGGTENRLSDCFDAASPQHQNLLRPSRLRRAELAELLEKLTGEYYGHKTGSGIYARALLTQFMVELNRLAVQAPPEKNEVPENDLVSRVLGYIGTHYREKLSLESLAGEFFVSKYHLAHEFSQRVGISVYRYIVFRRLALARELMASGQTPGEVYQNCGFGDYANFYRAFTSEYGMSPSAYAARTSAQESIRA